jgi:hypothetical protein
MSTRKGRYLSLLAFETGYQGKPPVVPANKHHRFRWLLLYLLLTSAAVIVSTTFPFSPWSLLLSGISYKVEEVIDPASDWDDNIWPIRQQTLGIYQRTLLILEY